MEIFSPVLKKIEKKFNIKIKNIIGKGLNGVVYEIGGGQVLKITRDEEEAFAAKKLIGKNFNNVVIIFRVFTTKKKEYPQKYFIVEEKLFPLKDGEKWFEFYKFLRERDKYQHADSVNEILKKCDNKEEAENIISKYDKDVISFLTYCFLNSFLKDVGLELEKFNKKFQNNKQQFYDILNALKELENIGIKNFDIHEDNIMKRNNDYIVTDIKHYNSEKIDILENKKLVKESSVQYARTKKQKYQGLRNIPEEDWEGMMVFTDVGEGDTFVGKDCLFDIRIAFLDGADKVLSLGIIKKDTGMVVAPKGTAKAIETNAADDYRFYIDQRFPIPARTVGNRLVVPTSDVLVNRIGKDTI
jgi:uncharacterized membrane protein (UPF0127 family)